MKNQVFHSIKKNGTQIIIDMENAKHTTNIMEGLIQLVKDNKEKLNYKECHFLNLKFGLINNQGDYIKEYRNEYHFFKAVVVKYPELMPKILEYVKLFKRELNPQSGDPAGMFAISVLAETDIKYVKDFILFMKMCDLNHPLEHYNCIEKVFYTWDWSPEKLELAIYAINAPGQKHPSEFINLTNISPEYFNLLMEHFDCGEEFEYGPEDILTEIFPDIEVKLLEKRYNNIPNDKTPTYKFFSTGAF